MILLEWDEGDKEEGEPHAGGSAYDGRVMTFRTDTRSAINDLEFVRKTEEYGEEEEHGRSGLSGLNSIL